MRTTEYLYGVEPSKFKHLPYKEALEYKLKHAAKLYIKLFTNESFVFEERERLHYVEKARNHTKQLLEELNGSE